MNIYTNSIIFYQILLLNLIKSRFEYVNIDQ